MEQITLVKQQQVEAFAQGLAQLPQVQLDTEHYFANGMYARKVARVAGTAIVGKVHRHEHFFMLLAGRLAVMQDGITVLYQAGDIVVSKPGTQRVTLALTDAIVATVHRTDQRDLDKIEEEIIEPGQGPCFFDARNELINPQLEEKQP